MAVLSRSLIVLALALSVFGASTPPTAATKVTRANDGGSNGGGDHGGGPGSVGGGSHGGGANGPNGGGEHGGGGGEHGGSGGEHGGSGGEHGGEPHHPTPSHRAVPRAVNKRLALANMNAAQIAEEICPGDAYGCPIAPAGSLSSLPSTLPDWLNQGFYCVDRSADLTDCGGCAALDAKHDCTLIKGANSVSCVAGSCVVDSCFENFTLAANSCSAN